MARRVLLTLLCLAVAVVAAFAGLGWWSSHGAATTPGLRDGRLPPCSAAPNCVTSEAGADAAHTVSPYALPDGDAGAQWDAVRAAVLALGGELIESRDDYLHATFTSRLFRFVDDLEVRRDGTTLHLRSASRVGYSDLGANRARIEALRARIDAEIAGR